VNGGDSGSGSDQPSGSDQRTGNSSAGTGSVARVRQALAALGVAAEVRELPDTTRTAVEAARTVGCQVEQIAKPAELRASGAEVAELT
jgi:hypothetical protein